MEYRHGKFVWFEHASADIERASAFYSALVGWKIQGMPMGAQTYHMILNGNDGIGGLVPLRQEGVPSHWMSYLSVADVDAAAAAATNAGAKVLMPPTDFPPVGRGATLADPTGAVFSIWKSAQGDRPDTEKVAPGDWYWNECWAADDISALTFYEKAFGFSHQAMDMGPQGTYFILMKDGVARAGLMKSTQSSSPPAWLPYICVSDCDASTQHATVLGAQVLVPATDIPNVGRFSVLMDPLGAAIAIMRGTNTAA